MPCIAARAASMRNWRGRLAAPKTPPFYVGFDMPNTFHRVGHGPHPVIVLHGWFGDAHSFTPIEPWLSKDTFSYVFMDYRGYGGMREIDGAYTIDEIAADAIELADALGFGTFSLVGHSMGGMTMERVATLAADRVRTLVGIAPVPCGGVRYDVETRQFLEAAKGSEGNRRAIIDRSTGGRLPSSWVEWKAAYSMATSSPDAFAAYLRAWTDRDFSEAITGVHPVHVLVGEHDPTFNAGLMEKTYLRRYRYATVEVLKNAGRYPMNETPLALVAGIEGFLRERGAPLCAKAEIVAKRVK
jgi:pimeloyl-ACP methyl ester carboxylesterase